MTTPAQRAAERIYKDLLSDDGYHRDTIALVAAMIEDQYAPLIKQAREAMEKGTDMLSEYASVSKCHCEEAWTGRGMHQPESLCDLHASTVQALTQLRAALEGLK